MEGKLRDINNMKHGEWKIFHNPLKFFNVRIKKYNEREQCVVVERRRVGGRRKGRKEFIALKSREKVKSVGVKKEDNFLGL
jgi:hypothetical protein